MTVGMQMIVRKKTCPICGRQYTQRPALSRKDNKTQICPDCGVDEALDTICGVLVSKETCTEVRNEIHRIMKEAGSGNG